MKNKNTRNQKNNLKEATKKFKKTVSFLLEMALSSYVGIACWD